MLFTTPNCSKGKIQQMSNKQTYPYMFKESGPNMSHEFCTHEMEGSQFYYFLT